MPCVSAIKIIPGGMQLLMYMGCPVGLCRSGLAVGVTVSAGETNFVRLTWSEMLLDVASLTSESADLIPSIVCINFGFSRFKGIKHSERGEWTPRVGRRARGQAQGCMHVL